MVREPPSGLVYGAGYARWRQSWGTMPDRVRISGAPLIRAALPLGDVMSSGPFRGARAETCRSHRQKPVRAARRPGPDRWRKIDAEWPKLRTDAEVLPELSAEKTRPSDGHAGRREGLQPPSSAPRTTTTEGRKLEKAKQGKGARSKQKNTKKAAGRPRKGWANPTY